MVITPFRLVFVCTGNIARSPMAHACAVRCLQDSETAWDISSAGTDAIEGDEPRSDAVKAASTIGIQIASHRARLLTPEICTESDLLIAMVWDQVAHVWGMVPDAWARCFTLKEFVHYARQAPMRPPIIFADEADRMRERVASAHELRRRARTDHGFFGGLRSQDVNLLEPEGRSDAVWKTFAKAVDVLVTDVIHLLAGSHALKKKLTRA